MGFLRSKSKRSASGRAQFTTHHDSLTSKNSPGNMGGMVISSALHSTSQLFVAPDNGDPLFRSQTSVWGNDANLVNPGHWTYVLFDPDRPDHCDIDRARLLKEFGPRRDGDHRLAIPKDVSDEWFKSMRAAGRLSDAEFADARPATAPSTQG